MFVGRGAELERELPFAIWIDALDDHVAGLGERRLEALIGDRVAELARVLPSAASGRRAAACRTSASTPTARCAPCCSGWRWASRSC